MAGFPATAMNLRPSSEVPAKQRSSRTICCNVSLTSPVILRRESADLTAASRRDTTSRPNSRCGLREPTVARRSPVNGLKSAPAMVVVPRSSAMASFEAQLISDIPAAPSC